MAAAAAAAAIYPTGLLVVPADAATAVCLGPMLSKVLLAAARALLAALWYWVGKLVICADNYYLKGCC